MEKETHTCEYGEFTISKSRGGLIMSEDTEGNPLVYSLDKETCLHLTPQYMKWKVEGFPEVDKSFDSYVGGKL